MTSRLYRSNTQKNKKGINQQQIRILEEVRNRKDKLSENSINQ